MIFGARMSMHSAGLMICTLLALGLWAVGLGHRTRLPQHAKNHIVPLTLVLPSWHHCCLCPGIALWRPCAYYHELDECQHSCGNVDQGRKLNVSETLPIRVGYSLSGSEGDVAVIKIIRIDPSVRRTVI